MYYEIDDCVVIKASKAEKIAVLSENVTYHEFFNNYMLPNIPCIIPGITKNWNAHYKWLKNNKPNLDYLKNEYGQCEVTIYDCNEKYFNSQKTESCKFQDYIDNHWRNPSGKHLYLKDWHLRNLYKNDNFYNVPIYFASDWLNEFLLAQNEDDYRFVYMGKEGTWTPFHADVFTSFSWSANLIGQKRWIFLPPGEENLLKNSTGALPYDISTIYQRYQHFEVIQNSGDAIFVPSGWYHQVFNLKDTISINHNWINACNIAHMWESIKTNLDQVKKEIEDCKEMDDFLGQCQLVLKASYGMDFFRFYEFLEFIARKRLEFLKNDTYQSYHEHKLGRNHAIFDLKAIHKILEEFIENSDVKQLFNINHNVKQCLEDVLVGMNKT